MSLLILVCVILLPIVPAYLLFRALPSHSTAMTGPLRGVALKLGGAFAGYFAVVVLIFYTHNIWSLAQAAPQVWRIYGQVTDESGKPIDPLDAADIQLSPPNVMISPNGHFSLTFVVTPQRGDRMEYPILIISHPSFQERTILLDPSKPRGIDSGLTAETNHASREIIIQSIALHKLPPYDPVGSPSAR